MNRHCCVYHAPVDCVEVAYVTLIKTYIKLPLFSDGCLAVSSSADNFRIIFETLMLIPLSTIQIKYCISFVRACIRASVCLCMSVYLCLCLCVCVISVLWLSVGIVTLCVFVCTRRRIYLCMWCECVCVSVRVCEYACV